MEPASEALANVIVNVDPRPGSEATWIEPSWPSTTCFVKTSPRPSPSDRGFVVTNGWNRRARLSASMAQPVSRHAVGVGFFFRSRGGRDGPEPGALEAVFGRVT